ncbi:MAG TPA: ABC transporter [Microscillaceae bacterium]|nr:ABC transporter [Microscillaceae bacterium]
MQALAYLNKYLYKYKSHLIWGTVFIIISNLFSIIPAQIVRFAFDLIKENIDLYFLYKGFEADQTIYWIFTSAVIFYGVLIVLMAILRGIFLFFVRQTLIVMSRLIEYDMKHEIYAHYQSLPLSFYRKNNTGDLMARISEDVSQVRMYLGPAIMYGLNMITLFVMVIGYMFWVDVTLSLWTLLPLPILSISIYYVNNLINSRSEAIQRQLSVLSSFVQEAFSGIRVLKAFSREQDTVKELKQESETYRSQALKLVAVEAFFYPLILGLIGLSTLLVVYIGGIQVMEGTITPGIIAEFIIYVNLLTWPVTSLGWITSITQRAEASQARINEFLQTQTDLVSTENLQIPIDGQIEFKNVSFVFPDSGIEALHQVSFNIPQGKTLAILGTTGAGKSTIANLICRMYDATQGEILIDNRPIQAYHIGFLRGQMGYVPQDVFLFSDTIRNNINFGLAQPSEEKMLQAARDADLYENVMHFTEGFDTKIGERGITLSGGQKQRVSIARAIVREPKILILDDSLSAVDTKTENAILNALQRIMEKRTSIIISHRVSSAKLADHILVLDEGRVIQQGSHESLINQEGFYKDLYERQLQIEDSSVTE